VKFAIFEYVCGNCLGKFDAPSVVEMSYGEFLLCSNRDALACLNAVQDATFQEVGDLISHDGSSCPRTEPHLSEKECHYQRLNSGYSNLNSAPDAEYQ
jgi:hypothetical protein